MSEIQVEVCFTDKLESVRVGGKNMEIPKAVKAKPVEEWFEPAAGRVKWRFTDPPSFLRNFAFHIRV